VHSAAPRGNTALFDAMAAALEHIKQGRWNNRALIIISDGEDNRSRITLRKLRQMILEAGVTVYAVIPEETRLPHFFGARQLRALSAESGGRAFSPNTSARLAETFDQIALEMRQRYSIGYAPANAIADGRWRRLEVKVAPPPDAPRLVVKTRTGYYAAPASLRTERHAEAGAVECCQ
jgi:Ca-activated chloride channel family protein